VFVAKKKSAGREITMRRLMKSLKPTLGKAIRRIQRNHTVGV
jgi:hypothetical protein